MSDSPAKQPQDFPFDDGAFGRNKRWLYAGGKPNAIAQFLNWGWGVIHALGIAPNYLGTLDVVGRKSGRVVSLPVAIAVVDGRRYLVSMLGEQAQWVQNVRAAGGQAVLRHGRRETVRLAEVPAAERAPILKAYLKVAPGARPHIPVHKDAPLADFERVAADFPAFELLPA